MSPRFGKKKKDKPAPDETPATAGGVSGPDDTAHLEDVADLEDVVRAPVTAEDVPDPEDVGRAAPTSEDVPDPEDVPADVPDADGDESAAAD